MACDLCDTEDSPTEEVKEPTPGKYCGHSDPCACPAEPPAPEAFECREKPPPGGDCLPNEQIRDLQKKLTDAQDQAQQAQSSVDETQAALEALTTKAGDLNSALEAQKAGEGERDRRAVACKDFIECKDPKPYGKDKECVDGILEGLCEEVDGYQARIRWLHHQHDHHKLLVAWHERRFAAAEKHYENIKNLATTCFARCEALRAKYEEARTANDKVKMYLYYELMRRLYKKAKKCCLNPKEYEKRLCDAFDALCAASDALLHAKRREAQLTAELAAVEAALHELTDPEKQLAEIERRVELCCKPSKDPGDGSSECSTEQGVVAEAL